MGLMFIVFATGLLSCSKSDGSEAPLAEVAQLTLTSPQDFVAPGSHNARGTATQVGEVTVNGAPASLNGDQFLSQVTLVSGVNLIEVQGIEEDGDTVLHRRGVLAGVFGDPDVPVEDAAKIRLGPDGLALVSDIAEQAITPEALEEALPMDAPLGSYSWSSSDTIRATPSGADFDDVALTLLATDEGLVVGLTLVDLTIDFDVDGTLWGASFTSTASVWSEQVELSGTLLLAAGEDGIVGTVEYTTLELEDLGAEIGSFELPVEWLTDAAESVLEDEIMTLLQDSVPSALAELTTGLTELETDFAGHQTKLVAGFADASVTSAGVDLTLDLGMTVAHDGVETDGYLKSIHSEPKLGTCEVLCLNLHDDVFNVALYQFWRAGFIGLDWSTEEGTLYPELLEMLGAEEGSLEVIAGLPPVFVVLDGEPSLQLAEAQVILNTPDGDLGDQVKGALVIEAPVDLEIVDGMLTIDPGQASVVLDVREVSNDARPSTVTRVIEDMLPLETLVALMGDLEFELPEVQGYSIQKGVVSRNQSGVHTTIDLSPEPVK